MRRSNSKGRPSATKPARRTGRPPKYPDGKRVVTKLRLPAYCHSAVHFQSESWGIDMGDLVAFYVITGWQHTHPQSTLPMPEYLQRAWNNASAAAEPMFPIPEPKTTDLTGHTIFLARLPEPVRTAISDEAQRAKQAISSLGAYYLLSGWNAEHSDKLPVPPHLIEAWNEVRGVAIRPRQEAMLA